MACRRASVNRPPTPDVDDDKEPEPTLQEIINIKVDASKPIMYRVQDLVGRALIFLAIQILFEMSTPSNRRNHKMFLNRLSWPALE